MNDTIPMVWEREYSVPSFHVNTNSEMPAHVMCQYMQEAAWHHASTYGLSFKKLMDRNLIWILSRMHLRIHRAPQWGDDILMETWPSGRDRLFCYRDYKITDTQGNSLVEGSSTWFVVDTRNKRPQRTDSYFEVEVFPTPSAFVGHPRKLSNALKNTTAREISVRYADLDVHKHVNNTKYVEWMMDDFPLDFHTTHTLRELEVNYLAEALPNDALESQQSPVTPAQENTLRYAHAIVRPGEKQDLCRARTIWTKNTP